MSLLGGCHFELESYICDLVLDVSTLSDTWKLNDILKRWWMDGWMDLPKQLMAKRWKFWFSASQIVIHNAKRKCGIQREFMWFLHNWRQKMQSMHWCTQCWCTEWWCICREAEKSFGTNLSPFLLLWCREPQFKIFWEMFQSKVSSPTFPLKLRD